MNLEGLELGKVLSSDVNLKVREGRFRNDNVMIKEYNISEMSIEEKKRLRNELKILEIINSRYLVHHYANLMLDNKLLIVLESFPGKTLREYMNLFQSRKRYFNEKTICRALFNLSSALKYLHEEREFGRLVHRSINPDTIMLTSDGEFVLGDLGLTKFSNSILTTLTNEPSYRAPEMLKDDDYNYKVDIWSIGCVLYEMCSFKPLFNNFDTLTMSKNSNNSNSGNGNGSINKNKIERIPWRYSNDLWKIIKKCLKLDVNKRCDSDYILHTEYIKNYINENEILPKQVELLLQQKPELSFDRYPLPTESIIPAIYINQQQAEHPQPQLEPLQQQKQQHQQRLISSFSSSDKHHISSLSSSLSSSSSSLISATGGSYSKRRLVNENNNNNLFQYGPPLPVDDQNEDIDDNYDEYTSFIKTHALKSVEIKALVEEQMKNERNIYIFYTFAWCLFIFILVQLWYNLKEFFYIAIVLFILEQFYYRHYKKHPVLFSYVFSFLFYSSYFTFLVVWKSLVLSFWIVYYSMCCCFCCNCKSHRQHLFN